jgi:hypothetical protein
MLRAQTPILLLLSLCFYSSHLAQSATACDKIFRLAHSRISFDLEWERIQKAKEKEVANAVLECPKYSFQACVAKRLEEGLHPENPHNKKFFESAFEKSCLKSGLGNSALAKKAMANYIMTASIALTSTVGGYYSNAATTGQNKFPISYLATSQIFLLIGSEIACRNISRSNDPGVSSKKVLFENFKSYTVMNAISNILYIALMMTEDHLRGDLDRDFQSYLKEGVVSMAWDTAFAGLHDFYFDKVMLQSLPQLRDFINQGVKNKFFSKADWVKVNNEWVLRVMKAPGFGTELSLRWLYSYARSFGWQRVSTAIQSED